MHYPVREILSELREKLNRHPVVILQAPPGAGKSTILPIELMSEPWLAGKKIIMLEPRRLAARSVAMRMASLTNCEPGQEIGYRIRFESRTGPRTKVEVVTEGILTRLLQRDNALTDTGLVVFDEFHERSLHADLAFALCLQVQQVLRPDLRILIMSATMDASLFSGLLGRAPVIKSEGRQYPVVVKYEGHDQSLTLVQNTVMAVRKAVREERGDILVFLPGAGEIRRVGETLASYVQGLLVYPLFGDLSYEAQQKAILPDPSGRRKVILSTSIAETSLTIEGVSVVIDSGYARVPRFNPRSGFTGLETVRVTKDSADQRAGRAGRLGPGVCYRLWSEAMHATLVAQRTPEILEADLAPVMLELLAWGIRDVNDLGWITAPPPGAVAQALEILARLGAVDSGKITEAGRAMLKFPTHPRLAHMMLEASRSREALGAATDVAALLEEKDPLGREAGTDLALRVDALRQWRRSGRTTADRQILQRVERIARSWRSITGSAEDNEHVDDTIIGEVLMAAYPERVARRQDPQGNRYKLANGRVGVLHDSDPLNSREWIVIADLDASGRIFLAAPVDVESVTQLATEKETVHWDASRGMVTGLIEMRVGNVVVSTRPLAAIPDDARIRVICDVVRENGLTYLGWEEKEQQWQSRVLSLRAWRPSEPWPDVSNEHLLRTVAEWLPPFLPGVYKESDLRKLNLTEMLASLLSWEMQSALNRLAPERIEVPSGSMIRVQYFADGAAPAVHVRLQEVFGLEETPAVNEGRTRIVLHLLSPGFKPVQVTQDLRSFWNNTYPVLRKELRIRYPRHSWPEDPWTADAVRGAIRKRKD